jgi:hypothetical protein
MLKNWVPNLVKVSMIHLTLADTSEYNIPSWDRAEMINYLVEFIVSLRKPPPPLSADAKAANACQIKSMSLLHSLLQYWGDLDIDLSNIIEILLVGDRCLTSSRGSISSKEWPECSVYI